MDDTEKLEVTIHEKEVSHPRFLVFPKRLVLFFFPDDIGVHLKLTVTQNLVFSCGIRSTRIPFTLTEIRSISVTLISSIWTNHQLFFNLKDGGDLFLCRQAEFQMDNQLRTLCKNDQNSLPGSPPFPILIA